MDSANETEISCFPTTHWSLVSRAGQDRDDTQRRALGELLKRYSPALRAHLIGRKGIDWAEADDLVQDFLAAKVVERDLVGRADPGRGRFRTFLLTALDRFVANHFRDRHRQKRGGGARAVALGLSDVPATAAGPENAADALWAREVLAQAMHRMRDHCTADGRDDLWYIFEARMLTPMLDGGEPVPYQKLVADLNLHSLAAGVNLLTTAKRTFERALRAVIGEYEHDPSKIEEEIRDLRAALARGG